VEQEAEDYENYTLRKFIICTLYRTRLKGWEWRRVVITIRIPIKPRLNYDLNLKLLLSLASNREDISVICVELYHGKICLLFINTRFE